MLRCKPEGASAPSRLLRSTGICTVFGVAMGVAAIGAPANAQSAAEAPSPRVQAAIAEEVIVTARRREERLQDAPVAVTAVTGQQLQRYNVVAVTDLAKFVPTMVVGRQVTGSSASIFLRGVGSSSLSAGFDQSVSFNIDGLAMSRGREIALTQYDLNNVQVLKGPQALFFGKNATGGVIVVQSNNPTKTFQAQATAGYGFKAHEIYGEGFVSGPITDTLSGRFAFRAQHSRGYFINTALPTVDTAQQAAQPGGTFERRPTNSRRGGNDSYSGRATLLYQPTDKLSSNLKLTYTHFEDDGASDSYERKCGAGRTVPFPTSGVPDPYADCAINGRTDHATLAVQVASRMRYARPNGDTFTLLNSGSVVWNNTYQTDKLDFTSISGYYGFSQRASDNFAGATRTIWNTQLATMQQYSQEFRAQTKFTGLVNFTAGAFYSHVDFAYNIDSYLLPVPLDPATNTYSVAIRNDGFKGETYSGFVEAIVTPTPEIEISGGARYSHEKKDSYQDWLPANRGGAAAFAQNAHIRSPYREDNVSPQATVRWKPNQDFTAYASYKTGFKAGGYNISQTLSPTTTQAQARANGDFTSEKAEGFEGGVRTTLFDRSVHFNLTLYDYKYKNLQVQFFNPVTLSQVVSNAGSLTTKGAESDFEWRPPQVQGLAFRGAVAYNKAAFHNFIGQCYGGQDVAHGCNLLPNAAGTAFNGQQFDGRTPPKAPKWGAQGGFSYDHGVTQDVTAHVTADANYSSSYNYTDTLRPDGVQNGFTRIDASFALSDEAHGWRVSLIGRNLTNRLVVTSANDMTFTGGTGTGSPLPIGVPSDMNAVVERGREIYLEVRKTF